jgi:nitrite reductase/ring-hydroxylating ferredoxin subunit
MRIKNLQYSIYGLFVILFILFACKKQKNNPIPETYVSFYMNISSTLYLNLASVGGWENITGGYKGIVVYRKSSDEFMAFERACPYDWEIDSGYVSVNSNGLIMKCKSCGSEFLILDGSITKGPSTLSLKSYKTEFDGQTLHIYN